MGCPAFESHGPIGPAATGVKPLTYSDYINDRAMVDALRMPSRPIGVPPERWPDTTGWNPGNDWPDIDPWVHDEVLFIRTHQAFEVWFAQVMHEIGSVINDACRVFGSSTAPTGCPFHSSPHAIEQVHLDQRRYEAENFSPRSWPKLAMVVQGATSFGEDRVRRLCEMGSPARHQPSADSIARAGTATRLVGRLPTWSTRLHRSGMILKTCVSFFDILATMTPREFLRFRDRLQPASGFGSGQFRELEYVLGMREINAMKMSPIGGVPRAPGMDTDLPSPMLAPSDATPPHLHGSSFFRSLEPWMWTRLARRASQPALRDIAYLMLNLLTRPAFADAMGVGEVRHDDIDQFAATALENTLADFHRGMNPGPDGAYPALGTEAATKFSELVDELDSALSHRETILAAIVSMRTDSSPLRDFLEACLAVDAALLMWRDRHIRFVEVMIGTRRGTGGGGIQYLRGTVRAAQPGYMDHGFPALWMARSFVQRV